MRNSVISLFLFALGALLISSAPSTGGPDKNVMVITFSGAISPVSAEYITKSIDSANEANAEALIIEIDTPGGLDTSMRLIIKKIQASNVPIVVYVAPTGSRAASAGAFITISAHVAAMAPGTNIGAASPVNMGGGDMDSTMKKKVTNDARAYMRSIAELRGRNADVAEKMVRKGSSISEKEALEQNVIDIISPNLTSLLKSLDGRLVKTASGEKQLATSGATVNRVAMTWRQELFDTLSNPNIAYLLMMLGFYGLFFELSNPGAILPGIVGVIALILAFYSLQTLPINYAGALLILMGVIMFMLEIWVTSFGMLTIGGLIALVIGSLMLVDSPEEYLQISLGVILPTALLTAGFFTFLVGSGLRAQKRSFTSGKEALVGALAVADTDISPNHAGKIFVEGEIWNAVTQDGPIKKGDPVEISSVAGLTVTVKAKG
ncbi:Putative membrane-bound ClpP-class protease associated with aq_911 [hydrothermal vent metagenome]|uniref:Membrane-bound ClpP-class protease associated with aq_911 n=1 Tax=hydrothermal vent metagenome TaxID=652676 RepID=A0A3B1C916_9ZZZZ